MYSPQFRESAVALVVDKGRRVADVARDLESPRPRCSGGTPGPR
ncbi:MULTISPECIES: transposase [Nocardia]